MAMGCGRARVRVPGVRGECEMLYCSISQTISLIGVARVPAGGWIAPPQVRGDMVIFKNAKTHTNNGVASAH